MGQISIMTTPSHDRAVSGDAKGCYEYSLNPHNNPVRWALVILISQMRKVRHRKLKYLAQDHTARMRGYRTPCAQEKQPKGHMGSHLADGQGGACSWGSWMGAVVSHRPSLPAFMETGRSSHQPGGLAAWPPTHHVAFKSPCSETWARAQGGFCVFLKSACTS